MKNIFRIITVLLIVAVLFTSLTACKNKNDTDVSSKPTVSETVTSSDTESEPTSSVVAETSPSTDESKVSSVPDTSSQAPAVSQPPKAETPTQNEPVKQPEPQPEPKPAVKTAQELLIGKWSCEYDCSEQLAELGYADIDACTISAIVEFTPSGSYIATVNMQNLLQTLRPVLQQSIADLLASEGKTEDDFYNESGMTVSEYIDMALSIYSSDVNMVTAYKFEGDKLFVENPDLNEFFEASYNFIDDDTLSLTEAGESSLLYKRIK